MVFVISSPVLTMHGIYYFKSIDLEEAKQLLSGEFVSAISNRTAAKVLSHLLGIYIPARKGKIGMAPGDKAVVFRLRTPLPKNWVPSQGKMADILYDLDLLVRTN